MDGRAGLPTGPARLGGRTAAAGRPDQQPQPQGQRRRRGSPRTRGRSGTGSDSTIRSESVGRPDRASKIAPTPHRSPRPGPVTAPARRPATQLDGWSWRVAPSPRAGLSHGRRRRKPVEQGHRDREEGHENHDEDLGQRPIPDHRMNSGATATIGTVCDDEQQVDGPPDQRIWSMTRDRDREDRQAEPEDGFAERRSRDRPPRGRPEGRTDPRRRGQGQRVDREQPAGQLPGHQDEHDQADGRESSPDARRPAIGRTDPRPRFAGRRS